MPETLFDAADTELLQPVLAPSDGWSPRCPEGFQPERIVLAKGYDRTPESKRLGERICATLSGVPVEDHSRLSHSQIPVAGRTLLERHVTGKRTLVLGVLGDSVRHSQEAGNTCPNYWHFSPYGFCPYGCHYCYLAGTTGVKFSPTVKIYLNLAEMLGKVDLQARRLGTPTGFYVGKLQDGLALDCLSGYSRVMIPFFARHPYARLILLTKAAEVDNLLPLDHGGHTVLSWSLNPPAIRDEFEAHTPPIEERIQAMEKCVAVGYPVRAVIMPIIPVENWQESYTSFLTELLSRVPLQRLSLGGICTYQAAHSLMNQKLSPHNMIHQQIQQNRRPSPDGRMRYTPEIRAEMYNYLIQVIHDCQPELTVSLCLEEDEVWQRTPVSANRGKCNCLW